MPEPRVCVLLIILAIIVLVLVMKPRAISEGLRNVLGGGSEGVTVTYHYTTWCGFCKSMTPIWEKVTSELKGGKYSFEKNDEDQKKTPGVTSFPTIYRESNGVIKRYNGVQNEQNLRHFIMTGELL